MLKGIFCSVNPLKEGVFHWQWTAMLLSSLRGRFKVFGRGNRKRGKSFSMRLNTVTLWLYKYNIGVNWSSLLVSKLKWIVQIDIVHMLFLSEVWKHYFSIVNRNLILSERDAFWYYVLNCSVHNGCP